MKKKLIFPILSMVLLLSSSVTAYAETHLSGNNIPENITTGSQEDADLFHAQLKITQNDVQGLADGEKLICYKWNDDSSGGKWQIIDTGNVEVFENSASDMNYPLVYVSYDHVNWTPETNYDRFIILTKNAVGSSSEYAGNYENIIARARNSYNNYDIGISVTQENGYQIVYLDDSNNTYCWGDGQPLPNESPDIFLSYDGIVKAVEALDAGKPYVLLEKSDTYENGKYLYEWKNDWLSDSSLYSELRVVTFSENDNNKFYVNKSDGSVLTYARNISEQINPESSGGILKINNDNMSDISVEFVPDTVTATTSETSVSSTTTTTTTSDTSATSTSTTTGSVSSTTVKTSTTTNTITSLSSEPTTSEISETTVYTPVTNEEISTEEILTTVITPETDTSFEEDMQKGYNTLVKCLYVVSACVSIFCFVRIKKDKK